MSEEDQVFNAALDMLEVLREKIATGQFRVESYDVKRDAAGFIYTFQVAGPAVLYVDCVVMPIVRIEP